jgi:hypothetical protein
MWVCLLSGTPLATTCAPFSVTEPENGCGRGAPATGFISSTVSCHTPGTGLACTICRPLSVTVAAPDGRWFRSLASGSPLGSDRCATMPFGDAPGTVRLTSRSDAPRGT